jgi:hypothetical protein
VIATEHAPVECRPKLTHRGCFEKILRSASTEFAACRMSISGKYLRML